MKYQNAQIGIESNNKYGQSQLLSPIEVMPSSELTRNPQYRVKSGHSVQQHQLNTFSAILQNNRDAKGFDVENISNHKLSTQNDNNPYQWNNNVHLDNQNKNNVQH